MQVDKDFIYDEFWRMEVRKGGFHQWNVLEG